MRKTLFVVGLLWLALLNNHSAHAAGPAHIVIKESSVQRGAVGDVLSVKFELTSTASECMRLNIYADIVSNAEVREKIEVLGPVSPDANVSVEEDAVIWIGREIHPGESMSFSFFAKIKSGTVGDVIHGLDLTAKCLSPYGNIAVANLPISVVAKKAIAPPTIPSPTRSSLPQPPPPQSTSVPRSKPAPVRQPVIVSSPYTLDVESAVVQESPPADPRFSPPPHVVVSPQPTSHERSTLIRRIIDILLAPLDWLRGLARD